MRPHAAYAHYLRAKAALALGRRGELADGLKQAKALGYPDDELAVLVALIDAQDGRIDRATPVLIRAFHDAKEPDPMLDEALARVLMERYDWPHAGAVLGRWAEDAPLDPRPPLWRAIVHRRRDAVPEVIAADFREALRRSPELAEARLGLAEELARAGRHREAVPEYDAYLAVKPDDPLGLLGAGRNALELGDLATADRLIDRALALNPESAEAQIEKARCARTRGDDLGALPHLDKAIALRPFDPDPRYSRVLVLKRLRRPDDARREQAALERLKADLDQMEATRERLGASPNDLGLQVKLARWMFSHGFDQEGLKWAGKILADHPGDRETCSMLADYHEKHGNHDLAGSYRSRVTARPSP